MSRTVLMHSVAVLLASFASGCCCFGDCGGAAAPERDDRGAEAEARRYYGEHADDLAREIGRDAGPGSTDGCVSGLGSLALSVAASVASRGHAGGNSAAQVSIDTASCFERVVVLVVLVDGAWRASGAVAHGVTGGTASVGSTNAYIEQETVSDDIDLGSDELF